MLKGPYPGGSEEENTSKRSGNPDVFSFQFSHRQGLSQSRHNRKSIW